MHAAQVVFSEALWIGKKNENSEEHKLPMPMAIIEAGRKAQGILSAPLVTATGKRSILMCRVELQRVC